MNKRTGIIIFLLMGFFVNLMGQVRVNQVYLDYIDRYKDMAIGEMLRYNIPASITLAQGLLESNAGRSELARKGNNHFGIKCHGWTGRTVHHDDDARQECFRAYDNALQSFEDHSQFLVGKSRYASLFRLSRYDYIGWAHGLKAAGYATNPKYANSLINIIEAYNLQQYDRATKYDKFIVHHQPTEATPEGTEHIIKRANRNYYVIAREGDSFKSIGKELGISYRHLAKYNERNKKDTLASGDIIYLKAKRTKADKSFKDKPHTVNIGESMYSISQKYGIRLKSLYKRNKLSRNYEIKPGDELKVY